MESGRKRRRIGYITSTPSAGTASAPRVIVKCSSDDSLLLKSILSSITFNSQFHPITFASSSTDNSPLEEPVISNEESVTAIQIKPSMNPDLRESQPKKKKRNIDKAYHRNDYGILTGSIKCTQPYCQVQFNDQSLFYEHQHTIHQMLPFVCLVAECGSSFMENDNLADHISTVHSGTDSWKCSYCSKSVLSYRQLEQHIYWDHFEGSFWCAFCTDIVSNTRQAITAHLHRAHSLFYCPHSGCSRVYKMRPNQTRHQQTVHATIKPYSCTWDGCSFTAEVRRKAVRHVIVEHLQLDIKNEDMLEDSIEEIIDDTAAAGTPKPDPSSFVGVNTHLLKVQKRELCGSI